jgi:hypothetical protein
MGNSISLYSNIQSGGGESSEEKVITLSDTLDFIASYYILTMDFKTLSQLHEKKYCDELVVLTSDIINKYFSDLEVERLVQRIESGASASEKLVYFKKSDIDKLNVPDSETKKGYCIDIAKFYIKIAHVFAAIVTTINPEYVYKDVFGNTVKKSLIQKSEIPSGVATQVSKINLCSERINALKGKQEDKEDEEKEDISEAEEKEDISETEEKEVEVYGDETVEIKPDICTINLDKNGEKNYLDDEPGINELIDLYFDGDYDFKSGKFMGMTTETEKQFQDDLKRFYLAFTDSTDMPPDIKKFGDIKLRDYSTKKFCKSGKNGIGVKGTYKDELFLNYADNLKAMIQSVNVKQDELLRIINKIFVYVLDPVTEKEVIRVNPDLTESGLQELVVETRKLIIELYLKCETDFVEGVKIYEAIVESQIFNTTQKHIEQLEKEREKLIAPYKQQSDKIPL